MSTEWRAVPLSQILTPVRVPVAINETAKYRQVTVAIKGRGLRSRGVVAGSSIKTKRQFQISTNRLLVSKIDARNGAIGIVPPALDGAIVSGDFPVFEIDEEQCLPAFLDLYVRRPSFWEECLLVSEGSTNRVRLVVEQFLDLEVDLPPLPEQRTIVAAVEVADDGARAWTRETEAAGLALHAAREELLYTEGNWEELPSGWKACSLAELADVRSGITKGRKADGELVNRPFIRAANVQDGFLDLSEIKTLQVSRKECERFELLVDDVLLTEGGNAEHVGRGWLWQGQLMGAVYQNHVFRARVQNPMVIPRFLAHAIGASPARAFCLESAKRTTNLASINKTQISMLPVPVPPLTVQEEILRKLEGLRDGLTRAFSARLDAARVRSALVEELVTGVRPAPQLAA